MDTIKNLRQHPIDSTSLVLWMLTVWDADENASLILVCRLGKGADLVNRIRVRFSKIRRQLRMSGETNVKQFGLATSIIHWTLEDGTQDEAVIITRTFERRHNYKQIAMGIFNGNHPI